MYTRVSNLDGVRREELGVCIDVFDLVSIVVLFQRLSVGEVERFDI